MIVLLFLISIWSAAPVHPGDWTPQPAPVDTSMCLGGRNATRTCCIDHGDLWISEVVPLDEIDYLQIEPYSCANPSYCLHEAVSSNGRLPKDADPRSIPYSQVPAAQEADPDRYFSNSFSSCAELSFILCKHLGDRQWECYAKAARDDVEVSFVQNLECAYVDETLESGRTRTMLRVGSCVINQVTWRMRSPVEVGPSKPYALLSSNAQLHFPLPIINPAAVDALNAQGRAINRIVRKSDVLFAPAFLPPMLADDFGALPPSLQRSLIELVQLVFRSAIFTMFCAFLVMVMGVLFTIGVMWTKMSVLHARVNSIAPPLAESSDDIDDDGEVFVSYKLGAEKEALSAQLYPATYVPAAADIEAKV